MRQRTDHPGRHLALPWTSLTLAGVVGVLVVVATWLLGPGALGIEAAQVGTSVPAQVTVPAPCSGSDTHETVTFAPNRTGQLSACGHDKGEHVDIVIPDGSATTGTIPVAAADTVTGSLDLRGPLGLALVALSCVAGAGAVILYKRSGPHPVRPTPASSTPVPA